MALKEYTTMTTKDWLQVANTAYKAYVKARSGNNQGSEDDEEEKCNGIIQVGGHTRSMAQKLLHTSGFSHIITKVESAQRTKTKIKIRNKSFP